MRYVHSSAAAAKRKAIGFELLAGTRALLFLSTWLVLFVVGTDAAAIAVAIAICVWHYLLSKCYLCLLLS